MHDLVIRGGTVIDGTGQAARQADIAIDADRITKVGNVAADGRQEIDATGKIVTPGFVDLHSHYDAQALWDPVLAPSSWHGVTTVIMGNCSVGLAPLHKTNRKFPLAALEAIEEIPVEVMDAALDFDWESFPDYLDALDRRQHSIDLVSQIAHIALRAYVMGDRAAQNEPATDDDIAEMKRLAKEALAAGAIGISGSRTLAHRYPSGEIVPGAHADKEELLAMADAVAEAPGRHVMQYVGDVSDLDNDILHVENLSRHANKPVHFIISDNRFEQRIAMAERGQAEGRELYAHLAPRAVGMLGHWRSVEHPFSEAPSMAAIADLPWPERLAKIKDPEFKVKVIAETKAAESGFFKIFAFEGLYEVSDYPDYEPDPATDSIAARALAAGQDPYEHAYDVMTARDGTGMFYIPIANYSPGDHSKIREMLQHPQTVISLADGGAHCTRVCDGAASTFMLAHWSRDRKRGPKLPLEEIVKYLSRDTAFSYGLEDRGILAEGYLADLNIIDFDHLKLPAPYIAEDFPTGGLRLLQKAEGYVATIKSGVVTFEHGEHCGQYPGKVVRGPQMARVREEA